MTKAIVVDATNEIDAITALMAKDISMKLRVANILEGAKVTFLVLSSSTINKGLLLISCSLSFGVCTCVRLFLSFFQFIFRLRKCT
jgi:hypothetical protein